MEINPTELLAAYVVSTAGGHFAVRGFLRLIRWHTRQDDDREPLAKYIGCVERVVATTLVLIAPLAVGPFIIAWVAAKIAANWQRLENSEAVRKGTQTALLANVVSFSVAIGAGLYLNRRAEGLVA